MAASGVSNEPRKLSPAHSRHSPLLNLRIERRPPGASLLNQWAGNTLLGEVCNETFARFKSDRLVGRTHDGKPARKA